MKKTFQVAEYLTERNVKLRLGKPVNVRLLSFKGKGTGDDPFTAIRVEDLESDDPQPAFIDDELFLKALRQMFPKNEFLGAAFQITKLPRVQGGKENKFKIARLKVS